MDAAYSRTQPRYGYTDSDPLNRTDPTGLCTLAVFGKDCDVVSTLHELVTHPVASWQEGQPDYYVFNPSACITATACRGANLTITKNGHIFAGYETGGGRPGFVIPFREGWIHQNTPKTSCDIEDFVNGVSLTAEGYVPAGPIPAGLDASQVLSTRSSGDYQQSSEIGVGFGRTAGISVSADHLRRFP